MTKLLIPRNTLDESVDLYLKAKAAYYEGREIMSDAEFDQLEALIKEKNPEHPALSVVGYSSKRFEFPHWKPMLSLEKIQVNDEVSAEYLTILKWITQTHSGNHFVIQPKYDGNSLSAQYKGGKLIRVLTRGNGKGGFDVTDKIKHLIPETIPVLDPIEIRGECLVAIDTFAIINQNDLFKNERNFVAGVLSDTKESPYQQNLSFIIFSINGTDGRFYHKQLSDLKEMGFDIAIFWEKDLETEEDLEALHQEMKEYREESVYRLDGYVLKVDAFEQRKRLGENKHHPLSEIAIKFAAQKAETIIESVEWTISAHNELIPTAILKPVYLDGSMVSRAYLANLKNAINNSYLPGSKVQIEKKGDIIPQITALIAPSPSSDVEIAALTPQECPYCHSDLNITEDLTHIHCMNTTCPEASIKRMSKGLKYLKVKHVGPAMVKTLHNAGLTDMLTLFSKEITDEYLIKSGFFKEGRQLDRLLESLHAIRSIRFEDLIRIQQIEGVGETIAGMITRYYTDLPYDFSGLEKQLIEKLVAQKAYYYEELPAIWQEKTGITITFPQLEQHDDEDVIYVVLTGSPKSAGYPTKKHFLDRFTSIKEVKKLKEADYLVTGDLSSTSKKMKDAEKLGKEIRSYQSFEE